MLAVADLICDVPQKRNCRPIEAGGGGARARGQNSTSSGNNEQVIRRLLVTDIYKKSSNA